MTFIVFLGNLSFYSWSIYQQNCGDTRNELLLFIALEQLTRSSESDGRSDVTDSLDCPDWFRLS